MDQFGDEYADYNEHKAFLVDLETAHIHAQRALDALYSPSGPKRGFWYRIRLGRAQSTLISLHTRELSRRKNHGAGD